MEQNSNFPPEKCEPGCRFSWDPDNCEACQEKRQKELPPSERSKEWICNTVTLIVLIVVFIVPAVALIATLVGVAPIVAVVVAAAIVTKKNLLPFGRISRWLEETWEFVFLGSS